MKVLTDLFREWMPHQRWFGKGREWADVSEDGFFLDRGNPVLSVHRVRVTYTDGRGDLPGPAVVARPPGRGPRLGVRGGGPQRERRDLRLRRDAGPGSHRPVADPPGQRLDHRADALPPAGVAYIPRACPATSCPASRATRR